MHHVSVCRPMISQYFFGKGYSCRQTHLFNDFFELAGYWLAGRVLACCQCVWVLTGGCSEYPVFLESLSGVRFEDDVVLLDY